MSDLPSARERKQATVAQMAATIYAGMLASTADGVSELSADAPKLAIERASRMYDAVAGRLRPGDA